MTRARWIIGTLSLVSLATVLWLAKTEPSKATSSLYPDLRTLPARNVRFDIETIDGTTHHVLRFTTIIWNAGQGPLELRGDNSTGRTLVYQRIYDDGGRFAEALVGEFTYHETHNHWHFENFARYELWTRTEFDEWQASGRQAGWPRWLGSKTTGHGESFCIRDSRRVVPLNGSPESRGYRDCGQDLQGVSVGWADSYPYYLPEQWIDLGQERLPQGDYVLRLIADPQNLLYESDGKSDPHRESLEVNEALTFFDVKAEDG
jgi:hypothetical protein